jgi:hypothetical protein
VARVAALYDVHGNLPALEAVLAEPDVVEADLMLVGGDFVSGPMPRETFAALQRLGPELGSSAETASGRCSRSSRANTRHAKTA